MPDFDHVIIGSGLSGLLLAAQLTTSGDHGRVMLADPRPADTSTPVTYAYWADRPTPLDRWAIGSWSALTVVDHQRSVAPLVALQRWRYVAVDWAAARADLLAAMSASPSVHVEQQGVDLVRDGRDQAAVRLSDRRWVSARWVFDSRPPSAAGMRAAARGARPVTMHQAFRGVWVRADDDVIDTTAATLLDFSADDGPDLGFAYVLPVSPRRAMVMAVRMSEQPDLPDPLPAVPRVVVGAPWRVESHESGVTPLVTPPPSRRWGRRVLVIGRRGGRVRPSTGYAVARVLADSTAVARSLRAHGHPFDLPPDPRWERSLDAIWLRALRHERAALEPAFVSLFTGAPVDSVLRFLDGVATPVEVAAVVRALPPGPFVRAALRRW